MTRIAFTIAVLTSLFFASAAPAQDAALKKRFSDRLPQVEALLRSGAAGENNQGYLEARGSLSSADNAVLKAENADRRTLYKSIATDKSGISAELVGQRRAQDIRQKAKPGVWVQLPDGSWKR